MDASYSFSFTGDNNSLDVIINSVHGAIINERTLLDNSNNLLLGFQDPSGSEVINNKISSLIDYMMTNPTASRAEHGYVTLVDTSRRTDFENALTLNETSINEPGCKYLFWAKEPGTENYYYFEGWFSERAYTIHTGNQYTWDNQQTITPPVTFTTVIDFLFGANAGVAIWGGGPVKYGQDNNGNWCRMCTVHPETGKAASLLTSMLALKTSALAADGCLDFLVLQLFKDNDVLVRVDRWSTKEKYEAFNDTMKTNRDVAFVSAYADWPNFGTLPSIPLQFPEIARPLGKYEFDTGFGGTVCYTFEGDQVKLEYFGSNTGFCSYDITKEGNISFVTNEFLDVATQQHVVVSLSNMKYDSSANTIRYDRYNFHTGVATLDASGTPIDFKITEEFPSLTLIKRLNVNLNGDGTYEPDRTLAVQGDYYAWSYWPNAVFTKV